MYVFSIVCMDVGPQGVSVNPRYAVSMVASVHCVIEGKQYCFAVAPRCGKIMFT